MRGNWIEHTATGGSGDLSLTAVSGSPTYADVFGASGSRLVEYEIENSDGSNAEAGVGTIDLSTLSLARTTPIVTWDGTDYVNVNPTALTFSGTVTVRCAPLVSSFIGASPYADTSTWGVVPLHGGTGSGSTGTYTNNQEIFIPFYLPKPVLASRIIFRVTSAYTGGTSDLYARIYDPGTDARPGKLRVDFGAAGTAGSAFASTGTDISAVAAAPAFLLSGEYILSLVAVYSGGSGTPRLAGAQNMVGPNLFGINLGAIATTASATSPSTTAPDPANVTGFSRISNGVTPMFGIKGS